MSINIKGRVYYRTAEACKMAGISRATLFRWIKEGIVEDVSRKDRNGWRLFTANDINKIKSEATRLTKAGAHRNR